MKRQHLHSLKLLLTNEEEKHFCGHDIQSSKITSSCHLSSEAAPHSRPPASSAPLHCCSQDVSSNTAFPSLPANTLGPFPRIIMSIMKGFESLVFPGVLSSVSSRGSMKASQIGGQKLRDLLLLCLPFSSSFPTVSSTPYTLSHKYLPLCPRVA